MSSQDPNLNDLSIEELIKDANLSDEELAALLAELGEDMPEADTQTEESSVENISVEDSPVEETIVNQNDEDEDEEPEDSAVDKAKDKVKNVSYTTKKTVFLVLIALAIFVLSFAIQYVCTDILRPTDSNEITNWMFVTGQSDAIVKKADTFNQANKDNLISKPMGENYVRCVYNTDKECGGKLLKVNTEYAPIKILADGEEIYNNGYGKAQIVGNCYNEVVLPQTDQSQKIELYMYYPMSFSLSASIVDNTDTSVFAVNDIGNILPTILAFAMLFVGIIMILTIFGMMFRSKDITTLLGFSFTMIATGFALAIREFSTHSMMASSPYVFGIVNVFFALSVCLVIACLNSLAIKKSNLPVIVGIVGVAATALTFIPMEICMRAGMIISALAILGAGVLLFRTLSHNDNVAMEGNSASRILVFYSIIVYVFNSLASSLGLWRYSEVLSALSAALALCMLYFFYAKKVSMKNVYEHMTDVKSHNYALLFDAVSDIISQQEGAVSNEDYIKGICDRTVDFLEKSDILTNKASIEVYAGVKYADGYGEVYRNEKAHDDMNFDSVAEVLALKDNKFSVGSSFFELMISGERDFVLVFNNTFNTKDSDLYAFVSSLYKSISDSYANYNTALSQEINQENIFINIADLAESKGEGTSDHLARVEKMTTILANEMGYGEKSSMIGTAAKLHDVGKISISSAILNKRGPLTQDERQQMMQHIISGYNILSSLKGEFFQIAREIALEHHENYDGTGYMGKKGEDISQYARIVKVVDVCDALLSKRPYKKPWSVEDTISYIYEKSGSEFDPNVVQAFINCADQIISLKEIESV